MKNNVTLTCPNNACKRVITNPLKTLNRQQNSTEPYYACPYCLTEINFEEAENNNDSQKADIETGELENKSSQNQEKPSDCKHYFGFMSEKEHKLQMPEECMLCTQIMNCMAKGKN